MQWKEIEITDRELLQRAFENINSQASEMSFANMYMWRYNYNTRINVIENMLCMVSDSRRFIPFAFCPVPLGVFQPEEFRKAVMALKVYFNDQGWKLMFGRVEEKNLALFKRCPDFRATFKKIDANSDYVYNTESLIALAGKKLSSKRNHINKFLREYGSFEYVEINKDNITECKRIFDEWCEKNDDCECEVKEECEKWACSELLDNWDRIPGLKGALIGVNGRFQAFTIGEMLNSDTAVIHIEKGNTDINGIYPLINREFIAGTFSHTRFVNREEDMGKAGLKQAKSSYHPAAKIHKYNIYPEFK